MDTNIFSALSSLWSSLASSSFFHYFKIVAGFVTAVLLIADILLLSKRARTDITVAIYGANVPKFKKEKYRERWANIMKRVEEEGVSGGKISLVEADRMFDEVLDRVGYKGKDIDEKISQIPSGQLIGVSEVALAHNISEQILFDPAYEIDLDGIRDNLAAYERFFSGLEIY
ncbi:MAG: hypothetical protein WC831_01525 [Parcubacteria group bacterium]|jgi:hypothetical protein